ncbi:AAA-ATPase At5g57480-like [Telopea speciosissima]|uniref:AAA-ATPase At5g57480-like n=1 Tax=Telopea speciosissima TaxID=54955 RepID=UPI001CC6935B|nr:AAA-ATPase At5g57480-like [Telopea speciosissima]
MKEFWTSLASLMGLLAFSQGILHAIFPPELRFVLLKLLTRAFQWFFSYCYFDITEIDGVNTNELYNAVQLYLSSSASITANRLSLTRARNSSNFTFGLSNNECLIDTFDGVTARWEHVVTQRQSQTYAWRPLPDEKRGFTLRIKKKDKALILDSYLDYIMEKANEIRRKNQDRLLYTNSRGGALDSRGYPWEAVPFKHPSTFDTLAMDPAKKAEIMADLRVFSDGQSFYQNTGRAWKRGYLLYGPPGTGKSSMIAAMANYLGYDIYDLELTEVHNNSELRKLLMKTTSKSIIVIEDIDCSINLTNRTKPISAAGRDPLSPDLRGGSGEDGGTSITLSGLLNFTDGLWSCCGSERIFVFTTNHIEKLDPALLRSGRMDMHIYMSFCSFPALKILLKNYLGLNEEEVEDENLKELEEVIDEAQMTPADISEVLIKKKRDKGEALSDLLEELKNRAERNREQMAAREKNSTEMEEEEQEKRALESPKEGCEIPEKCSKGADEDQKEKLN